MGGKRWRRHGRPGIARRNRRSRRQRLRNRVRGREIRRRAGPGPPACAPLRRGARQRHAGPGERHPLAPDLRRSGRIAGRRHLARPGRRRNADLRADVQRDRPRSPERTADHRAADPEHLRNRRRAVVAPVGLLDGPARWRVEAHEINGRRDAVLVRRRAERAVLSGEARKRTDPRSRASAWPRRRA